MKNLLKKVFKKCKLFKHVESLTKTPKPLPVYSTSLCSVKFEFNTKTGRKILPNADMNCKSRNLIYCIKCPNCDEIYIGQTGNALSERTRIHRQQIRDPNVRQIPLSNHLETCGNKKFSIFPFHKMYDSSEVRRRIKENNFIEMFKPVLNG